MKTVQFLFISMIFLTSCSNDEDEFTDLESLLGTWELKTYLFEGDILINVPEEVTIQFNKASTDLTFGGNSSCNTYGGEVAKINRKIITLSDLFSTERACPDERNSFESMYYEQLPKINEFSIDMNELVLLEGDTYLIFEKRPNE